jgi:hypothetical protein
MLQSFCGSAWGPSANPTPGVQGLNKLAMQERCSGEVRVELGPEIRQVAFTFSPLRDQNILREESAEHSFNV